MQGPRAWGPPGGRACWLVVILCQHRGHLPGAGGSRPRELLVNGTPVWRTAGSGSSLSLSYQRPLTQPAGWLSTGWPVPVWSWQVRLVEEEAGRRGLAHWGTRSCCGGSAAARSGACSSMPEDRALAPLSRHSAVDAGLLPRANGVASLSPPPCRQRSEPGDAPCEGVCGGLGGQSTSDTRSAGVNGTSSWCRHRAPCWEHASGRDGRDPRWRGGGEAHCVPPMPHGRPSVGGAARRTVLAVPGSIHPRGTPAFVRSGPCGLP